MLDLQKGYTLKSLINGMEYTVADVREERLSAEEVGKIALVVEKATTKLYWIPFSRFVESKFEVIK